ncbi:MAG: hypothetical protein GXY53_09145 [Desulfobulbus sp.]|nr:hypothetical protein [Desulfobulbus sp.]
MVKIQSFTKIENELLPKFRKQLNEAESTEDVKKFFVYCIQELCDEAFDKQVSLQFEDISLQPEGEQPFLIADHLLTKTDFVDAWQNSDLPHIIGRFADQALGRYRRLEKNPAKTEAKIRM